MIGNNQIINNLTMELSKKEIKFYKKYGINLEKAKEMKARQNLKLYLNYEVSGNWAFKQSGLKKCWNSKQAKAYLKELENREQGICQKII